MHLSCLKERFPQCELELRGETEQECAFIRKGQYAAIEVWYFPTEHYTYCVYFADHHIHTCDKEEMIAFVTSIVSAEKASIEFFLDGKNRFGGEISTADLDDLTYDSLRCRFGYPNRDLTGYTFKVRACDERYCFDGVFVKGEKNQVQILKRYIRNL